MAIGDVTVAALTNYAYSHSVGYVQNVGDAHPIRSASTEYKFLDIVTASLEWRDILNSQRGFNASMSATGWSETQQYGNTSMVVLRLAVKLNHFR